MTIKNVQKFVEHVQKASSKKGQHGSGLVETGLKIEQVAWRRSIKRALVWLGFGLAFLALAFGNSWVTESPLFNVLGTGACFVSLCFCWVAGGVWWFIRGSEEVCVWAKNLLPFSMQPYRSIAGIPSVFIIIRVFCDVFFLVRDRIPWHGKNLKVLQALLRWGLWLLVITAWLAAFSLTMIRFIDPSRLASFGLIDRLLVNEISTSEALTG